MSAKSACLSESLVTHLAYEGSRSCVHWHVSDGEVVVRWWGGCGGEVVVGRWWCGCIVVLMNVNNNRNFNKK